MSVSENIENLKGSEPEEIRKYQEQAAIQKIHQSTGDLKDQWEKAYFDRMKQK